MTGRKTKRPPRRRKAKRLLKFEQIDPLCCADILRAARGEPSAWPADNYPTHAGDGRPLDYRERFERGDHQMMLWAIVLSESPPKWAIDALKRALIEMAVGADWTDVFGRERAERGNKTGANRDSIRFRAEKMYHVWNYIEPQRAPGNLRALLDGAADEFDISRTVAERFYRRMERYHKQKSTS